MQNHWTKDDVAAAWQRFERTYAHDPVAYRFLCGHCIQDETDEDALDYNIIGVWLVCHRKYRDWSTEKSYDRHVIRLHKFQYPCQIIGFLG